MPNAVALEAMLKVVRRCGLSLLDEYFREDAWRPYVLSVRRVPNTLGRLRETQVMQLEEDAAAKRKSAAQLGRQGAQFKLGHSRTRTLSPSQLREVARQRQATADRLRTIPEQDLAILQKALDVFVRREGGRHALAALAPTELLVTWLTQQSFRCAYCGELFFPLGSLTGGRPRTWCSNAHKLKAARGLSKC